MLAFAIMADVGDDLRGWLAPRLLASGWRLGDDGAVTTAAGEATGVTWAVRPPTAHAARPWHQPTSPCRFVAPLAGYVELAAGDGDVERPLARALARIGRGVVARLADDRAWSTVALRTVAVEDAVALGGLDDGAALLDRDPASAYAADVVARVVAAAASRGLKVALRWRRTERNPLELFRVQPEGSDQLYPPVWASEGRAIDRLHPLRGLTVALWLHDVAALD